MILMYHKIDLESPTVWWVDANNFYRQMVEIASKEVVYLDDYDPNNKNHVVITFDGIYKNVFQFALPILKHFGYPFELFLTFEYIGKNNAFDKVEPLCDFTTNEELIALVEGGGRLQWHTKTHINLKNCKDLETIEHELEVPQELKKLDVNGFDWFAYPHGEFNDVVVNQVKRYFKGALSCNQGNNKDVYILNRLTVVNNTKLNGKSVSCIIASYNYGDYLIEAIESVLHQTVVPDEILISDDCSDDDTQLIAEGYVSKYPELIRYNRNVTNLGIVDHFNKAISLTTGEYIFFLGADNRLVSNYVEACIKVLDRNEKVAIAYTDYALFGSRAKLAFQNFKESMRGPVRLDTFYQVIFPEFENQDQLKKEIEKYNFIQGSSMYKRQAFEQVGGYINSKKAEDYNLFKRIVDNGWHALKANNTNLEYRQHNIYQANNIVGLQHKLDLYKNLYLEKSTFQKTRYYKYTFLFYKSINFLKKNKTKPKKIIKTVLKKLF